MNTRVTGLIGQLDARHGMTLRVTVFCALVMAAGFLVQSELPAGLPKLQELTTVSPLDQQTQMVRYWAPPSAASEPTPLFVFLHSWSSGYEQDNSKWLSQAVDRGWIFLHADFRGANTSLKACGSRYARQDILDAMDAISKICRVDPRRIYLAGVSGGGHMSMLMAGHHPDRFSAVSSWVGISDLADWHQFHTKDGRPEKYARMIEASLGGPPGESPERDADYRDRSPIFHIHQVGDLPIRIYAGVEDGHSGSVPVTHSLRAFNQIARAKNATLISESEMDQLRHQKRLANPAPSDLRGVPGFERDIILFREAGNAAVTIFEGGHESLPTSACDWLAGQTRLVRVGEGR